MVQSELEGRKTDVTAQISQAGGVSYSHFVFYSGLQLIGLGPPIPEAPSQLHLA